MYVFAVLLPINFSLGRCVGLFFCFLEIQHSFMTFLPVILFCLFYSRIQAASHSRKERYFPKLGVLYWDLFPNSKGTGCIPKKAIKSLQVTVTFRGPKMLYIR